MLTECKTGRNTHQMLHVCRVWLGIDCLQIALELLLVLYSAIRAHGAVSENGTPRKCTPVFTLMLILIFQQAAEKEPTPRCEWAERKKRLMTFFKGNEKVKASLYKHLYMILSLALAMLFIHWDLKPQEVS